VEDYDILERMRLADRDAARERVLRLINYGAVISDYMNDWLILEDSCNIKYKVKWNDAFSDEDVKILVRDACDRSIVYQVLIETKLKGRGYGLADRELAIRGSGWDLVFDAMDSGDYDEVVDILEHEIKWCRAAMLAARRPEGAGGPSPRWYPVVGELWFEDLLIKRFEKPAKNQRTLLGAFEELGWPPVMDDPLPGKAVGLKRSRAERLKDAVDGLNQNHLTPGLLRFGRKGKDQVYWRASPSRRPGGAR
jgi:hypothetical protein